MEMKNKYLFLIILILVGILIQDCGFQAGIEADITGGTTQLLAPLWRRSQAYL